MTCCEASSAVGIKALTHRFRITDVLESVVWILSTRVTWERRELLSIRFR